MKRRVGKLLDITGKKVYEGDLFEWKGKIKEVVWYEKNLRWSAQNLDKSNTPKGLYHYRRFIKIIRKESK